MELQINFPPAYRNAHTKQYVFVGESPLELTERIPPQAVQIIQLAYALSQDEPVWSLGQLAHYIDDVYEQRGETFTKSSGGSERIVRYYFPILKRMNVIAEAEIEES